jgi:tetratricopeptide (TPR) repeat protein
MNPDAPRAMIGTPNEVFRPGVIAGLDENVTEEVYLNFSVANWHALRVHPGWEELKALGNAALAAGKFPEALICYERALEVTCPTATAQACVGAFQSSTACASAQDVGKLQGVCAQILQYVPLPPAGRSLPGEVREPNLPMAICLANMAACYLQMGQAQHALGFAESSVEACPEYVKGRYRIQRALAALGREDESKRVQGEIKEYTSMEVFWYADALFALGWIDANEHCAVYASARAEEGLRCLKRKYEGSALENAGLPHSVCLFASVQSLCGHSRLVIHVEFMDASNAPLSTEKRRISCMWGEHLWEDNSAADGSVGQPWSGRHALRISDLIALPTMHASLPDKHELVSSVDKLVELHLQRVGPVLASLLGTLKKSDVFVAALQLTAGTLDITGASLRADLERKGHTQTHDRFRPLCRTAIRIEARQYWSADFNPLGIGLGLTASSSSSGSN